eukprot:scaffold11202_cov101-Cylindrotheca_fusiformis.AAC.1
MAETKFARLCELNVPMIGMAAFATSSNRLGCGWSILANAFTVFASSCELKVSIIGMAAFATSSNSIGC